ncbi:hypothetical protein NPIL_652221, partial [Nephila pilipes]
MVLPLPTTSSQTEDSPRSTGRW